MTKDEKRAFLMVQEIEDYCKTNKTWMVWKKPSKNQDNKLYTWLDDTHYNHGSKPFKYAYLKNEDGVPIEFILDELFIKYGTKTGRLMNHVIRVVKEIKQFCLHYKRFPEFIDNPQTFVDIASNHYAKWLKATNYYSYTKGFMYQNFLLDGRKLIDILNGLCEIYGPINHDEYVKALNYLERLKVYCLTYQSWPKIIPEPKDIKEKESTILATWLKNSNYGSINFRYKNIKDPDDIFIEKVLDYYYSLYAKQRYNEAISTSNIWQIKEEGNVINSLSYYIIELFKYMYSDFEMYNYYRTLIIDLIKREKLNINFNELVSDLMLAINEQVKLYYEKMQLYQNSDLILAKLYENLYLFAKSVNESIFEERNKTIA